MAVPRPRPSCRLPVIAILIAPGCVEPDRSTEARPVTGGEVADSAHPAAVGLVRDGVITCSGTLVGRRLVITAAHCARQDPTAVFAGDSLAAGGDVAAVQGWTIHPRFDPTSAANDIAALVLHEPGLVDVALAPLAWSAAQQPPVGALVSVVGFGAGGPRDAGPGDKTHGTSRVDGVTSETLWLSPAPSLPCFGDSGGPVFADAAGSGELDQLVAVTSRGDLACVAYALATRVDRHIDDFLAPLLGPDELADPPEVTGGCAAGGRRPPRGATTRLLLLVLFMRWMRDKSRAWAWVVPIALVVACSNSGTTDSESSGRPPGAAAAAPALEIGKDTEVTAGVTYQVGDVTVTVVNISMASGQAPGGQDTHWILMTLRIARAGGATTELELRGDEAAGASGLVFRADALGYQWGKAPATATLRVDRK